VVNLANPPSFENKAVLEFFETSGRNLLAAEVAAGGVRHHVALSIVGTDRSDNGYFASQQNGTFDFRYGSEADIRFTPKSGHLQRNN
jgi:hypothetical protein